MQDLLQKILQTALPVFAVLSAVTSNTGISRHKYGQDLLFVRILNRLGN
jgi:hypothetical protein